MDTLPNKSSAREDSLFDCFFLTENDGNDITRVDGGTNIFTGGTDNNPITVSYTHLTLPTTPYV